MSWRPSFARPASQLAEANAARPSVTASKGSVANLTIVVATVTAAAILLPATMVTQAVGIAGVVACSGIAVMWGLNPESIPPRHRVTLCIAAGFLAFLCIGAAFGAVLSAAGVSRPLSRLPLECLWIGLLACLIGASAATRRDPARLLFAHVPRGTFAWAAVLGIPPVLALWGAVSLNSFNDGGLAVAVAILVVAMSISAVVIHHRSAWQPPRVLLLVSAGVTGAIQGPLRGAWLAGVDTQHEHYIGTVAIREAVFPLTHYLDPYGGMLSLTVLPSELKSLFGMTLRTTMVILPSIFLGLCVLALWSVLTERVSQRGSATLCSLFILGSVSMLQELPQITRQCYALFFFSVIVVALSSRTLSTTQARAAAVIGGLGVAVTHYSTAYLTAGAVLCGYVLSLVLRSERSQRVLSTPITAVIVGVAVLWGAFVARTGTSIGKVLSSIRSDGFNVFPGTGGIVSRWLNAASISKIVNASVIRAEDLELLHKHYTWMKVIPAASHQPLVNARAAASHGVPVVGSLFSVASPLLAQCILLFAAVSVIALVVVCRRRRELACLAGAAMFFLLFAAVSRVSQTIGVDFSPSRVELQAYLLFVVVVGVALEYFPWRQWLSKLHVGSRAILAGAVAVSSLAIATSTELVNFVERGAPLPATMSYEGEQAQRLITPNDVAAANWLAKRRQVPKVVQADRFGELALDDFGYNDRRDFVTSVDPIIVNNLSWVFAYHTNLLAGTARGGNNAHVGVFDFPLRFFMETRSVLYTSPTDAVFGGVPYEGP